ncbi:MAG: hypothetical protein GY821_03455 [Gammaproteobacteria bacterium]|nr:hypothetical protein [Gammaproteobacteria bacterium]
MIKKRLQKRFHQQIANWQQLSDAQLTYRVVSTESSLMVKAMLNKLLQQQTHWIITVAEKAA